MQVKIGTSTRYLPFDKSIVYGMHILTYICTLQTYMHTYINTYIHTPSPQGLS